MRILARVAEVMITGYKLERGVPKPGSGFKMKIKDLEVSSRPQSRQVVWGDGRMIRRMWSVWDARMKGQDAGGVIQEISMGQTK